MGTVHEKTSQMDRKLSGKTFITQSLSLKNSLSLSTTEFQNKIKSNPDRDNLNVHTLRAILSSLLSIATHGVVLLIWAHPRMHLSPWGLSRRQCRGWLGGAIRGHLRVSLHKPWKRAREGVSAQTQMLRQTLLGHANLNEHFAFRLQHTSVLGHRRLAHCRM